MSLQPGIKITVSVNSFGQWLVIKRAELRLTQKTVALALGVAHQTVSQWEKEKSLAKLNSDQLGRLCKLLNCSFEEVPTQGVKVIQIV